MRLIREVHSCKELKISSVDGRIVFVLDNGVRIESGKNKIYLQLGDQTNVREISVMLQWEEDDAYNRHWVRVQEKTDVCPMFQLPEGAMQR